MDHDFQVDIDEFISHQDEREFWFRLPASSIGRRNAWKFRARRPNLFDRASMNYLPTHLQDDVWRKLRQFQRDAQKLQDAGTDAKSMNEQLANNEANLKVADLFCTIGFVDPTLVLDAKDENTAQRVLHVERVKPEDRIAYLMACNDADSEQAKLFERFRGESVPDASRGDHGTVATPAPLRPAGDAGEPRPEHDPV